METLNWHNTMCDYYWELTRRNLIMGRRIDPCGDNAALAAHENRICDKHREYSLMLYDRLGLCKEYTQ